MQDRHPITIGPALYRQLIEFRRVAEAVLGENTSGDDVADLVVGVGLDALMRSLLNQRVEEDSLPIQTLLSMARMNPEIVYLFFARAADVGSGMEEWWRSLIRDRSSQGGSSDGP